MSKRADWNMVVAIAVWLDALRLVRRRRLALWLPRQHADMYRSVDAMQLYITRRYYERWTQIFSELCVARVNVVLRLHR